MNQELFFLGKEWATNYHVLTAQAYIDVPVLIQESQGYINLTYQTTTEAQYEIIGKAHFDFSFFYNEKWSDCKDFYLVKNGAVNITLIPENIVKTIK